MPRVGTPQGLKPLVNVVSPLRGCSGGMRAFVLSCLRWGFGVLAVGWMFEVAGLA